MGRETNTSEDICVAVLNALRYYSLFQYPLKAEEIYGNLAIKSSLACLLVSLEDMEETGSVYKHDGYYSIDKEVERWTTRRKKANRLAQVKNRQAKKVGRFIGLFPFVKFVAISGSLSKGYADSESDFDFFIVTAENRLWICRTILHLFKKITFLFGQQHKFCMNYFIDTRNLQIDEQNRYTAIELASLIPVSGYDTYLQLQSANDWVHSFLPNGYVDFNGDVIAIHDRNSIVKKSFEFVGNRLLPQKINKMLMTLTDKKWRKKWTLKGFPMQEYDHAFKTTLHVSKNHPANHQKRVLQVISQFEK